ncbi:MAG TPA: acetyl-CoA carboxylase biotin carboxyl carrier protein [Tepidisphaeraceae bacterium]|nr:acetyl-CoA carboxylase biotin carboxyl carrier protein [Tepidisphaeraceae bacterium]
MSEKKSSKKAPVPGGAGPMDVALLASIVKLMQANDLNMVDLRDGRRRVMLKRGPVAAAMPMAMPMHLPMTMAGASPPASAANGTVAESEKFLEIKSPMVGTFYAASSPDSKPFVAVGSEVSEETDVCVIEAMKVFNNVKAECRGTIAKIVVGNGQVVEFGQVLFLVKP